MNAHDLAKAIVKGQLNKQFHPYEEHIPDNCRGIILGSAPSKPFCKINPNDTPRITSPDMNYYYGGKKNLFWDAMFRVFPQDGNLNLITLRESEPDVSQVYLQEHMLDKNKLGIADILKTFYRIGNSAADSKLIPIELTKIPCDHFLKLKDLKYIFCTSGQVQSWLHLMVIANNYMVDFSVNDQGNFIYKFECQSKGKTIEVITIPSPSRSAFLNNNAYNEWRDDNDRCIGSQIEFLAEKYRAIFGSRDFKVHPPHQNIA